MFLIRLSLKNFIQIQVALILKRVKNSSSVLFDVYSEIHEHADGNRLFRVMSRGLKGEP